MAIRDLKKKVISDTKEYLSDSGVANSNVKLVPKGTVIMSFKLSIGRTAFAGTDLYTNEAIAAFVHKRQNKIDNTYFFYGLSHWDLLETVDIAVKGATLNKAKIAKIRAILPPLPEQKKIASILSTVDEKIEAIESQIQETERLKKGLMQRLLTQGIGHTEFKDSEIGGIPKSWEVHLLDSVAQRGSGHTPNKKIPAYWNGGVKWVSLSDSFRLDNLYISETDKEISNEGIENSSAALHPPHTVVLSRDAGVGKSAITTCEMAVSQHFMAWRCSAKLDKFFLYFYLQSQKSLFERIATGTTIKTIGLGFFKKIKLALPPIEEQEKIASILLSYHDKIQLLSEKKIAHESLKKGLMQKLLTGAIRVRTES